MKTKNSKCFIFTLTIGLAVLLCAGAHAQVNSGSNGSDGALDFSSINYNTNIVIDMHDHANGIYQYTYVNIPNVVQVNFIPNANNTPVTWLVQSNVVITGTVNVSGQSATSGIGGAGGPGGSAGGNGGSNSLNPSSGQGPGGGGASNSGGGGSFGSQAGGPSPGSIYGNSFLLPLLGGSGGGGNLGNTGGGGGGGAICIASSTIVELNGQIHAVGGSGIDAFVSGVGEFIGNGGSGGGVRIIALNFTGTGGVNVGGGGGNGPGGSGRIRIDAFQNNFGGSINGVFSQGFQPIIIPVAGQGVQLSIASVAGAAVSATPNGQLVSPDAIISGQQANPISVVVNCSNLPLNTLITLTVKPASGSSVSATGYNTTGTLASSMATISINMPRGGGIIYATAATSN